MREITVREVTWRTDTLWPVRRLTVELFNDIDHEPTVFVDEENPKETVQCDSNSSCYFLKAAQLAITFKRKEPFDEESQAQLPSVYDVSTLTDDVSHSHKVQIGSFPDREGFTVAFWRDDFVVTVIFDLHTIEDEDSYRQELENLATEITDGDDDPERLAVSILGAEIESAAQDTYGSVGSGTDGSKTTHNKQVLGFAVVELDDDTTILAQEFEWSKLRPLEVRIPLRTLLGKFKFDKTNQGVAAHPLSILNGWRDESTKFVTPDSGFDPEGSYQYGHLMPSRAGAPHNSFLIAPMHMAVNVSGPWRKLERQMQRMLQARSFWETNKRPPHGYPDPNDPVECAVATLSLCHDHKFVTDWDLYLRIRMEYKLEDKRIPSRFIATLHRTRDYSCVVDFDPVEHTKEAIAKLLVCVQPSEALKKVFQLAEERLATLDQHVATETAQTKHPLTAWHPYWKKDPYCNLIPESHVPRPYRCLDVLVMDTQTSDRALELLKADKDATALELLEAVAGTKCGSGLGFTPKQRMLARLYNIYKHGKWQSDLCKEVVQKLPAELRQLYADPADSEELSAWGGKLQAHADHHVPKSTGAGSNDFTNLLYVSMQQNLSNAQVKLRQHTNPHTATGINDEPSASVSKKEKPAPMKTGKDVVTRNQRSFTWRTRAEVVKEFRDRWVAEQVDVPSLLLVAAGAVYQNTYEKELGRPLPWTDDYGAVKKQGRSFLRQ